MQKTKDPTKRILLDQLPRLLSGYGKAFSGYPDEYRAAVIIVCDLDDRDINTFIAELEEILTSCSPIPETRFCIAIEEGEAWLLGDKNAVGIAFPETDHNILDSYEYDSICGTWEVLANAIYPGGAKALNAKGKPEVGRMKSIWASEIAPLIEISKNKSPSFRHFVTTLEGLCKPS